MSPIRLPVMASHACASANVVLPPFIRNHIPSPHQPHNTTTRTLTAHSHMCARPLAPSGCIVDRQWGGQCQLCSVRSHAVTHAVALTPLPTGGATAIRPRSSVLSGVILSRAEAAAAPTAQHHHPHSVTHSPHTLTCALARSLPPVALLIGSGVASAQPGRTRSLTPSP